MRKMAIVGLATAGLLTLGACSGEPAPAVPAPPAAPVSDPLPSYTLRVTGTVAPQTITWGFDGSSGSGDGVPFEKVVTAQSADTYGGTVSAVSSTGARGDLTCAVVDNATGETVDTMTASADGSNYAFASVACSVPMTMGPGLAPALVEGAPTGEPADEMLRRLEELQTQGPGDPEYDCLMSGKLAEDC